MSDGHRNTVEHSNAESRPLEYRNGMVPRCPRQAAFPASATITEIGSNPSIKRPQGSTHGTGLATRAKNLGRWRTICEALPLALLRPHHGPKHNIAQVLFDLAPIIIWVLCLWNQRILADELKAMLLI